MNPNGWLKETILENAEIRFSDGRPLYAYRCTSVLFDQMAASLTTALTLTGNRSYIDDSWAAMYCLYAAEWWRRNHESGSWAWSGIDQSLAWKNFQHSERYKLLKLGMMWWKREIMQRAGGEHLYLVTIACEGGLPLKLLQRENTNLSRYFKALLKEQQFIRPTDRPGATDNDHTLAESQNYLLPASLQNDVVYELSGQLIDAVNHCRQLLGAESKHPLEQLDNTDPDWRERFPLRLEDGVAQSLIADLLTERLTPKAKNPKQFCEVARQLIKISDDKWQPQLQINLPNRVPDEQIEALLSQPQNEETPSHLELRARVGSDEYSLAVLNKMAGQKHWRISSVNKNSAFTLTGEDALLDVSLHVVKGSKEYVNWTQDNCAAPSDDLPWLYVSPVGAEADNARQLDLIGVGSVNLRAASVFAAIPPEYNAGESRTTAVIGNVSASNRALLLLSESTFLSSPEGDKCLIELGAEVDLLSGYRVHGKRMFWSYSNRPVYGGMPELQYQTEYATTIVPAREIFWKPVGKRPSEWTALAKRSPVGDVRVRHMTDNGARFEARIVVVPKEARIEVKTGRKNSGTLAFHYFAATDIAIAPIVGCDISETVERGYTRFDVTSNAHQVAEASVRFSWQPNGSATLQVPVPIENSAFINSDGAIVNFGTSLSIDELMGLRAQVITPSLDSYHIEVELHDPGMSRNISNACNHRVPLEVERGIHRLPLGPLTPRLRRLLALRSTLDSEIRLTLSNNIKSRLSIKRFNTRLLSDWDTGVVQLSSIEETADTGFTMTAISLIEPELSETLDFDSAINGWAATTLDQRFAPWILVAWQDALMFSRPAVAPIEALPDESLEIKTPASMRAVLQPGDYMQRNAGMAECVTAMASDPAHVGWSYFKRCLKEFADYPPSSFDFTMRFSENPDVLALGLFAIRGDLADEYWTLGDKLGFDWHLLTLDAWVKAAVTYHSHLKASLPEELAHLATDQTLTALHNIGESLPGMDMLMNCISEHIQGKPTSRDKARAFGSQSEMLLQIDSVELLRRHVDNRQWPDEPQLKEWLEFEVNVDLPAFPPKESLQTLRDFRQAAVNAPIDAALQLTAGVYPGRDQLSYFLAFREFDSEWFDTALGLVLTWGFLNRDWTHLNHD